MFPNNGPQLCCLVNGKGSTSYPLCSWKIGIDFSQNELVYWLYIEQSRQWRKVWAKSQTTGEFTVMSIEISSQQPVSHYDWCAHKDINAWSWVLPRVPGPKQMCCHSLHITRHSINQVISANVSGQYLLIQLRGNWDGLRAEDSLRTAQCQALPQDKIQTSKGYCVRKKEGLMGKKHVISSWFPYGWRCAHTHVSQNAHIFSFVSTLSNNIRIEIVWVNCTVLVSLLRRVSLSFLSPVMHLMMHLICHWTSTTETSSITSRKMTSLYLNEVQI